jgi:hypothetical protein
MKQLKLNKVKYLPKDLEEGILYVSEEFNVAGHLCPCGCGNKIITPLTVTEWTIKFKNQKPTLYPSIGNWELPCRSHYWIIDGEIEWSYHWSDKRINAGRNSEEKQRKNYCDQRKYKKNKESVLDRLINYLRKNRKN